MRNESKMRKIWKAVIDGLGCVLEIYYRMCVCVSVCLSVLIVRLGNENRGVEIASVILRVYKQKVCGIKAKKSHSSDVCDENEEDIAN